MVDTVAVTLRMPGGAIAQFVVSYYANTVDSLVIAGTKGSIQMRPAYGFGMALRHQRIIGEDERGIVDQRPADGYPLLLSAGKLVRQVFCPVRQPDCFKYGPQFVGIRLAIVQ